MQLTSFFNPSSIAVVGVSENKKKVGYLVVRNCLDQGFKGDLYLINPKYKTLFDRDVYPSLTAVGKPIDLVVFAVPADASLALLDEVHTLGIKHVVIYAAGFKEMKDGSQREAQLIKKAAEYGITILGPNCIGFLNTVNNANVTFLKHPSPPGNIGFISQSGALGSLMVDYVVDHKNFGFSYFVSLGNKTIMDECDVLEFLGQDEYTKVIAMYLEDVKDGERFKTILTKVALQKPVVILKSGATAEGSKAAVSHTGSMMGDDQVYGAVFRQCGAIRAESFFEFMALLKMFSYGRVPFSKDIMILSNAGGVGVLLTDELIKQKLSLVTITEAVKQDIIKSMGADRVTFHNPIDLLGDASAFHYKQAIMSTIKEKNIGAVIILLTPQANTEIVETADAILEAQNQFDRPIYPIFMGEQSVGNSHIFFEEKKIASFSSYDFLPIALKKMIGYGEWKDSYKVEGQKSKVLFTAQIPEKPLLNLKESIELLKGIGIPVVDLHSVDSTDAAKKKAFEIGYPVVLKLLSETITHKTEVGGVIANIQSDEMLCQAVEKLQTIIQTAGKGEGQIVMQKMVKGPEFILGAKRDRIFGPVIMLGMGGIYAELLKETVSFVHPVSFACFSEQIMNSKIKSFVEGFRGTKPLDIKILFNMVNNLGACMDAYPQIQEVDVNPLIVENSGVYAVDARIVE